MWGLVVHHVTHHAMLLSCCQNIVIGTDHVVMVGSSSFLGIVRDRGEWFMVYWEILSSLWSLDIP